MLIGGETNLRWVTSSRCWGVTALAMLMLLAGTASGQSFDSEGIRNSLRSIVELQILNAQQLGDAARAESLYDELATLDLLTAEDLLAYEGAASHLADLELSLLTLTGIFEELADTGVEFQALLSEPQDPDGGSPESDGPQTPNSVGLTSADYDICPSTRSNATAARALLVAVHIAQNATAVGELVRDIADLGCGTVVVAIGAAGNPQNAACSISEGIFNGLKIAEVAANTAYEQLIECDGIIDGAEIEGSYERAADNFDLNTHIHGDLETHDSDLKSALATHDTDIKMDVATHDMEIKANLATHDNDMKAALAKHDMEMKALLADALMQILDTLAAHDTKMSAQHAAHTTEMMAQHDQHNGVMITRLQYVENLVNWVNMMHGQTTNAKIEQVKAISDQSNTRTSENNALLQEILQQLQNAGP